MNKKRERFEKVAAGRVDRILHYIDLLGNCSNKNNYEYSSADIERMYLAINNSIKASRMLYEIELKKPCNNKFEFK